MLSNPKKPPASQLMVVKRQNKKKQFRGHRPKTVGHPPMPSYCRTQRYRAHKARHSTPSLESCPLNRTWELSHTTLIVSDKIQNRPYKAPLKLGFLCLHRENEDRTKRLEVSDPYNIVQELSVQFSLDLNGRSLGTTLLLAHAFASCRTSPLGSECVIKRKKKTSYNGNSRSISLGLQKSWCGAFQVCVYVGHILLLLLLVNIFNSCPCAQRPWQDEHFINLINN